MITKYYYKSMEFYWGAYGTDLGYVLTKKFLTNYEINKGVVVNVTLDLDENKNVNCVNINILDTENKFVAEDLSNILEMKLNQIFRQKIKVDNMCYIITDNDRMTELVNELKLDKCFGIKD